MAVEQDDPQEARIGRIINEYLDRRKRGEPVSEEEVLRANPDLAIELREHLEVLRQVISVTSGVGSGTDSSPVLPKDALPGYEILSEIHRGAQGVVYLALQKATRRNVAVKVTREGPFAGWRDRARFDREIHVLGALKHPSIVTIHDSGTAAGCQFFVMDYIAGSPLDGWLTASPHDVKDILRVFVEICDAINAAHIKGIIHRDLKPGNIRMDEAGRPHILDFGLAKLATDREDMTALGQFVGSLPWTGPEQAQGFSDQIDTRTDVYALGVILFHMLTGRFPYEVVGPTRDVLNRIVTSDPTTPSTIRRGIDKDLDAIVLKCLRKEPQRRYQSAGELGRDVSSYLSGQAISARSDSGLYILGKLLRRHRTAVGVATAFAILIGVSLLASLSLWRRAATERDRALVAEHRADAKAIEAKQAQGTAELERAIAQEKEQQARRYDYVHTILLAQKECEQNNMAQVHRLLELCPADLREWEWYYLARLSSSPALLDIPTGSSVTSLAMSPDGQQIATGGWGGLIKIWNTQTGQFIKQLEGHSLQVNALSWSSNGQWIASGGVDMSVRLWEVRTGVARILEEGKQYINGVAFSPDSNRLVSGGMSKSLTFWEVPGGRNLGSTSGHEGEVSCVAYDPDGRQVASGEFLNAMRFKLSKVRLWDIATMQGHPLLEQAASIVSLAFDPSGTRIAAGSGAASAAMGDSLLVCDSSTGKKLVSLKGNEGSVEALAFSPGAGNLLASAGTPRNSAIGAESDHTLRIWDSHTGSLICDYSAHPGGGKAVAWSPDAKRVFSGGADGGLKAWPSAPPAGSRVLGGNAGPVLRIAFAPGGSLLASSHGPLEGESSPPTEYGIRVWDLRTNAGVLQIGGHKAAVLGLTWTADGKAIFSADAAGLLRLSDAVSGQPKWSIASSTPGIQGAACSAERDEYALLATFVGSTATLRTVSDGTIYRQLQHNDSIVSVAFSAAGDLFVAAMSDGEVKFWNLRVEAPDRSISTGPGLSGMALSDDSRVIAVTRTDGSVSLWDVVTGKMLTSMSGRQLPILSMAMSPDSQRIVTCATDNLLRIWDVQSAGEVYSLPTQDTRTSNVAFSPNGAAIATGGQDGQIRIWDAETKQEAQVKAGL